MTLSLSSAIICVLDVRGREIQLSARQEIADEWRWKVTMNDGLTLENGVVPTRIAAQVEAQRAFEHRLHRAGIDNWRPSGYRWNEVVG